MDYINQLLNSSNIPALTAFLLGILTAISPCPLCSNITAIGYISKNLEKKGQAFARGGSYALGRTVAYAGLAALLIFIIRRGEDIFEIEMTINEWGERIIGPALILIGLFMLFEHLWHFGKMGFNGNTSLNARNGLIGAFLLGILLAMAFCPTSALFYFGMLIPMSASEEGGYLLPVIFAVATSLPILLMAWIITFSIHNLGKFMGKIQLFQKWVNRIVALLFITIGIHYTLKVFFL